MTTETEALDRCEREHGEWDSGPYCESCFAIGRRVVEADATVADALDGVAMRRLRRALPTAGYGIRVGFDTAFVTDPDVPEGSPVVVRIDGWHRKVGWGSTIAEAADKCRESLTGG